MITFIANILGAIIRIIYNLVGHNYAISIILFTVLTKLILFPLYLMQMKSTEKMNRIAPQDKKIRDKYKNDKQKQAEELNKLYSENKINPLGGCLPLLIQIPIILAMFYIVKQPLTYIKQMPQDQIKTYTQQLLNKQDVTKAEITGNELVISNKYNLLDMKHFGLNFGDSPSQVFSKDETKKASPLSLIIPVLTIIFSLVQVKQMQKNNSMTDEQKEMQKTSNLMLPIFSGILAYTMPLALGVYWLIGNILQIAQQYFINILIKKDKEEFLKLKEGKKEVKL